jgi:GNAT superfamily N-acetyltransferase
MAKRRKRLTREQEIAIHAKTKDLRFARSKSKVGSGSGAMDVFTVDILAPGTSTSRARNRGPWSKRWTASPKHSIGKLVLTPMLDPERGESTRLLKVMDVHIDPAYQGLRLGSRLYIEGLRFARQSGFKGLISDPSTRNPNSNRVWVRLKSRTASQKFLQREFKYDVLDSVRPHAKRRGRRKRIERKKNRG